MVSSSQGFVYLQDHTTAVVKISDEITRALHEIIVASNMFGRRPMVFNEV